MTAREFMRCALEGAALAGLVAVIVVGFLILGVK